MKGECKRKSMRKQEKKRRKKQVKNKQRKDEKLRKRIIKGNKNNCVEYTNDDGDQIKRMDSENDDAANNRDSDGGDVPIVKVMEVKMMGADDIKEDKGDDDDDNANNLDNNNDGYSDDNKS